VCHESGVNLAVDPQGIEVLTALLALKEIKAVHENPRELRVMVEYIQERFGIRDRTLSICTDRCAMNESAFRGAQSPEMPHARGLWLPCICHLLNSVLGRFLENISGIVRPIFRLHHRFRKHGPFLRFLALREAPVQSIPSQSTVRWHGCSGLFTSISARWDYMIEFAVIEGWDVSELHQAVRLDVERLGKLADAFQDGQKFLETDRFTAGNHIIGVLLSIEHRIEKFIDQTMAI
jgi:hypothetical protein